MTVLVYVSGTGAVQGQFLCHGYTETNFLQYLEKPSCVPLADLEKYAGGKCVSGWFIEAPEKFDKPSPLAEFGLDRPPMSWQYVAVSYTHLGVYKRQALEGVDLHKEEAGR